MKKGKRNIEFGELVVRYLAGEMNDAEKKDFEMEIAGDIRKRELLDEYIKVWHSMDRLGSVEDYDLDKEWRLLENRLISKDEITSRRRITGFYMIRIAAVLIIGLIIATTWYLGNRAFTGEQVIAEKGIKAIDLPDGSRITLNYGSRIRYEKKPGIEERRVFLTGEAYFEVVNDSLRPFIIEAGETIIEVLGTSFNVNAYRENDAVQITVNTGIVALSAKRRDDEQLILRAGNTGTYDRNLKKLQMVPVADPNVISWKTKELYFENTPLHEAVEVINKVYGAELVVEDRNLAECPITVTFKNQSFNAVLNVLQSTLELNIKRSGGKIILEGTGCYE